MTKNTSTGTALTSKINAERSGASGAAGNCGGVAMTKRPTKQALVLMLLQRAGGVPINAIVEATGWLPHTARAALTGLRKKGHAIVRTKIDSEARYMISAATK